MERAVYELHRRYEQKHVESIWARLFVIFFVEEASECGIFALRFLVKGVEDADSATKMMLKVVLATKGHSRR
jgi:hypothetical protein